MRRDDARHLLRRLAFSATPTDEAALATVSREDGAARLVDAARVAPRSVLPAAFTQPWVNRALRLTGMTSADHDRALAGQARADQYAVEQLRRWWIAEMASTATPLRELMTLFLHDVIGVSRGAVQIPQALAATLTSFREGALDTVPALLDRLILDPGAMIQIGMDGHGRIRVSDRPAKLVLDRWTVGPDAYTDGDVEELSRALTGWTLRAPRGQEPAGSIDPAAPLAARRTGLVPTFDEPQFDRGSKTILGQSAAFDARGAVARLAGHRATAARYAALLTAHVGVDDPGGRVAARLAAMYRATGGSLAAMLAELTRLDRFWAADTRWTQIKSPVHLALGACRQLGITSAPADAIDVWLGAAGQTLFETPGNAAGRWPRQEEWVTPDRLALRYQLPRVLAGEHVRPGITAPATSRATVSPVQASAGVRGASAGRLIDQLDPAPTLDTAALARAAQETPDPSADLLRRIMMSPNYQLA